MAHVSKTAVSRVIASEEDDGSASGSSKSRGDYKKQRELEEMRKLGTAPAAVDESGKDINPHIPQYISDAPWYLDPRGPTLSHQRPQEEKQSQVSSIEEWYPKGAAISTAKVATKYRKGACENCGALTHKKRDCLERPRKVGAKYSGNNFAPDERLLPKLALGFDGKRDRWNGYNATAHHEVVEEYRKVEDVKKEVKKERLKQGLGNPEEDDGAQSSDEDEDKYVDKMDMPGTKVDAAERYTVRNLRIREDTAKYLRNLDPNSAYYDPKTRAMRKNPYDGTGRKDDEVEYAGDNFVRVSGDTVEHAKSQLFAWEAGAKGLDVHALAEPTKLEALKREYVTKKSELKDDAKSILFDKYGGEAHLKAPPRELIFAQTEEYVEYSRSGKLLKGQENSGVKSRYEEDIYPGNHLSVWGSYWSAGRWGYKCCHSFIRNSYCTGEAGKNAFSNSVTLKTDEPKITEAAEATGGDLGDLAKQQKMKENNEKESSSSSSSSSSSDSETDSEEERKRKRKKKRQDKRKKRKNKKLKKSSNDKDDKSEFEKEVQEAMRKQEEEEKNAEGDDRERGYHSKYENKKITDAEIEAHARKRQHYEDPMKHF